MATSTKKKPKPCVKPAFSITFRMGADEYKGEGDTLVDAMAAMPRPIKIMTKALVSISDGKKTIEQMFMPVRAKRLFYPLARPVLARQLAYLLK